MKTLRRGYQSKITLCESKNGAVIAEESETRERWKSYFEELINPSHETQSPD